MNSSDEDLDDFTAQKKVVIAMVQRRGRKCYTQVHNIPNIFDHERILKYWKKVQHGLSRNLNAVAASRRSKRRQMRRATRTRSRRSSSCRETTATGLRNF